MQYKLYSVNTFHEKYILSTEVQTGTGSIMTQNTHVAYIHEMKNRCKMQNVYLFKAKKKNPEHTGTQYD